MSGKRKIVDARQDHKGNISHVRLEGNQNFTPVKKAIEMAKQGRLENAHAVRKRDGSEYLRTNPDSRTGNNLDEMAQETRGALREFSSRRHLEMSDAVKELTLAQLAGLSEDQQRRVLDFARSIASNDGVAGRNLLRFAGAIEEEDLRTMSRAIEEGCEKIDLDEW